MAQIIIEVGDLFTWVSNGVPFYGIKVSRDDALLLEWRGGAAHSVIRTDWMPRGVKLKDQAWPPEVVLVFHAVQLALGLRPRG